MRKSDNPIVRKGAAGTGWLLIAVSPIIGIIPGPGFIIVFPIGLALVLRNSHGARRLYVRLVRRFPEYGRWTDFVLRRRQQKDPPPMPRLGTNIWDRLRGRKKGQ